MIGTACVQVEAAHAQYALSQRTETYKPLEDGMYIPMRWDDTVNPYTYVGLYGLPFTIFGESFKLDQFYPIAISKWGNVEIRNATHAVIIDPFHTASLDSLTPSAQVSLDVVGPIGDRILKIQWRDLGFTGFPTDLVTNFQMWMYERTSNVEFYYGKHSLECDLTDPTLQDAYVGMFIAPADFSKINKIFWIYGDPESPKVSKLNIKAMHCAFAPNSAVTLATPSAGVALASEEVPQSGLMMQRTESIAIENATSLKLYSVMGQLIHAADNVMPLASVAAGRYFLEYQQNGETMRRAVVVL